jgi:hypothetical protein
MDTVLDTPILGALLIIATLIALHARRERVQGLYVRQFPAIVGWDTDEPEDRDMSRVANDLHAIDSRFGNLHESADRAQY